MKRISLFVRSMSLGLIGSLHFVSSGLATDVTGIFRAHVIEVVNCSTCPTPTQTVTTPHAVVSVPIGTGTSRYTLQSMNVVITVPAQAPKAELTYAKTFEAGARVDFDRYGGSLPVEVTGTAAFAIHELDPNAEPGGIVFAKGSITGGTVPRVTLAVASNSSVAVGTAGFVSVKTVTDGPGHGYPVNTRRVALTTFLAGPGYPNASRDFTAGEVRVHTYYDFPTYPVYISRSHDFSFGSVPVGEPKYSSLYIFNKGSADLRISSIELSDGFPDVAGLALRLFKYTGSSGAASAVSFPVTIAPGNDSLSIALRWTPESATDLQQRVVEVRVTTNDPDKQTVVYPVRGVSLNLSGYESIPFLPGDQIAFGNEVPIGKSEVRRLFISNKGTTNLLIDRIDLVDRFPPVLGLTKSVRTVASGPVVFPHTIPPGGTGEKDLEVEVRWEPEYVVKANSVAELEVESSDPGVPIAIYPLVAGSVDPVPSLQALEEAILGWLLDPGPGPAEPARQEAAPGCVTAPPNMVSWHPGNGDANDIQGNNHGTMKNGATFAAGKVGQAFSFDGVDDYVDLGDRLDRGASNFTLEAWIKGDPSMNAWGRILDKGYLSGFAFGRVASSNKVGFEFLASGSQGSGFSTTTDMIDNTWHHVAVVKLGNTVTIYADGVAENNETVSTAAQGNTLPLLIGANPGEGIQGTWKGQIDEPTFYDRALSAQEIQAIYAAGSAGKCKTAPDTTEIVELTIDPATARSLTAAIPAFLGGGSIQLSNFTGDITVSLLSIPNDSARKLIRIDRGTLAAPSVQLPSGFYTGLNRLTFGPPEESGGTLLVSDGSYTAFATATIVNDLAPDGFTVRGTYSGVYNAQTGKISVRSQSQDLFQANDRLLNISTRMRVLTGDNVLIGGFIITGTDPKRVIIRGIGPSLSGVGAILPDPTLELRQGNTLIASNDNWKEHEVEVRATTIQPLRDLESAIVATLNPGAYTAILADKNGATGVGVVEVYDLAEAADSKLANISSRGFVDTGNNVMIGGLIIGSPLVVSGVGVPQGGARALVRAIGPSLGDAGVSNSLQDPTLELRDSNGALVEANDNWRSSNEVEIAATTIPPSRNEEAAIVRTLPAGAYTAIVRGAGNTTGVAVVEVYNLQ